MHHLAPLITAFCLKPWLSNCFEVYKIKQWLWLFEKLQIKIKTIKNDLIWLAL